MDAILERKRSRWLPRFRSLRRIQVEVAILAIVLAMGIEAFRLGPIREALISHHEEAAKQLEWLARGHERSEAEISTDAPESPDLPKRPTAKDLKRAQAYRGLARWYRWQAWRYRLPLFTSVSRYRNLGAGEIDTREFIKQLGYMEQIERKLSAEEGDSSR